MSEWPTPLPTCPPAKLPPTAERLDRLNRLVHYLHHDLKIPGGKQLLDAAIAGAKEQQLQVPDVLVTFVVMFVAFDQRGEARTKRQLRTALDTGAP